MDRNHVSLIELGRKSPSVRMLFRLCTALGVSASDLLKEVDKEMHINRNR
jgi:transcriptional regulator with XRE-family HTH domain